MIGKESATASAFLQNVLEPDMCATPLIPILEKLKQEASV